MQVFGVTRDPFIVYTSNIFAILSLRALYGFVATVMSELRYLDKSVALVLGFIGAPDALCPQDMERDCYPARVGFVTPHTPHCRPA